MNLTDLIESDDYKNTQKKITSWNEKLKLADNNITAQIRDEFAGFFSQLKKDKPQQYAVFQGQHKQLSETVYEKLTGKKIIID
ncbi:MAG: hypothetical protein ABID61_03145 [Candidatus Micrarchaeota archaeon]